MISTLNFDVSCTYFYCFIIKGTLAYGEVEVGVILQINKV